MDFDVPYFVPNSNVLMACHITGVHDVNRNNTLEDDNYELVRDWAESVAALNLQGIIFHNNLSSETCNRYKNKFIHFIRVNYNSQFNPNVYRYIIYTQFLQKHINHFNGIFVTDVSDVTLINNPFIDPYFINNPNSIFCGDEPKILNNEWMVDHSTHLRSQISDFAEYENKFGQEVLLNCGIIGGYASVFFDFIQKLSDIHQRANFNNQTAFTGDMGAFNYLARTQFNVHLKHGAPVNTIFKMYENERTDCWFKHK
jgi:hypothetical protein